MHARSEVEVRREYILPNVLSVAEFVQIHPSAWKSIIAVPRWLFYNLYVSCGALDGLRGRACRLDLMAVLSVNARQTPWLVPGPVVFNWSPRAC